jgi:Mitochondrial carrier protein
MAPPSGQNKGLVDLRNGALLQMAEAATLGLPLEVWKTRMGRFRSEGTLTAFKNVYKVGGGGLPGVRAFWAGFTPKMIESSTKGAVLMIAKENLMDLAAKSGVDPFLGAILAGAGGGVAQTVVISPMVRLLLWMRSVGLVC